MKLHPQALSPEQRKVLTASAEVSQKWGAYLAGGASLAIQLGHRKSVDLDWFTRSSLPPASLLADIESLGMPVEVRQNDAGTFLGKVGSIPYSVFRYSYDLVSPPRAFEGCNLASLQDVAAMKMTAIVQRAVKRDYVDLYILFESGEVSIDGTLAAMKRKFPGIEPNTALRALTYFGDVDKQAMPNMLKKVTWQEVKKGLVALVDSKRGIGRRGPKR